MTRPTQHPASNSSARKREADDYSWGGSLDANAALARVRATCDDLERAVQTLRDAATQGGVLTDWADATEQATRSIRLALGDVA